MAMRDKSAGKKPNFFREVKSELKKVVYPAPKTVQKNTLIVVVLCIIVGIFIWALDWGFGYGRKALLEAPEIAPEYTIIPSEDGETGLVLDENGNVIEDNTQDGEEPAPTDDSSDEPAITDNGDNLEDMPTVGGDE